MKIIAILLAILSTLAGILLAYYGENDDSPGAVLLGIITVISGIFFLVKYLTCRAAK